jgi:hypothetical protein
MRKAHLAGLIVAGTCWCATGPAASGAVIFSDDFESYANTAAMNAVGAWGDASSTANPGTLATAVGNPGQSMLHPGGATAKHIFAETTPTDTSPLVWEFDFFWDGSGNKRISGGLRDNGVGSNAALLELGFYNATAEGSGFAYRTALLAGSTNWHEFPNQTLASANTWLNFKATIGASSTLFEVSGDLGNSSASVPINSSAITYDILRFGGPSDLSSAGGGANFDNVSVSVVPEPASHGLLALAAVPALGRRARCRRARCRRAIV